MCQIIGLNDRRKLTLTVGFGCLDFIKRARIATLTRVITARDREWREPAQ
jgi:hypothetical protein